MSGLGAFIQGAMDGYAFGEGVKSRKKRDKIIDEQLGRESERHDWARESHKSTQADAAFNREQAQRAVRRAEEERAQMRSIFDDAQEGYKTRAATNPADDPTIIEDRAGVAPTQGTPTGVPRSVLPPPEVAPTAPRSAPVMPPPAPRAPPQAPASMAEADTFQGGQGSDTLTQPRVRSLFPQDPPHRDEIREYVSSRPTAGGTIPQGAPTPEELRGFLSDRPTTGQNPTAPQNGRAPAVMPGQETTYARAGMPDRAPVQDARTSMQMPNGPAKPPVSPDDPPSVQAAAASAPANSANPNSKSIKRGKPFTSAQQAKATQTFLDYYAEKAVPKVVEMYLLNGDIEKAQAFDTWSKARETQSQLKSWSKAVHAATMGDEDGLLDHLSDTYNSFDDGYEVVRADSGFERDEAGNITGAKLTFKNTKTGEVFSRDYEDQSDLIEQGIYALAPETVFEMLWEQNQEAQKVRVTQQKGVIDKQDKMQSSIISEAARLRKQYTEQTLYGGEAATMPTDDEIMRQARDNVMRAQDLAAGQAVTQVQPAAQDWTGQ